MSEMGDSGIAGWSITIGYALVAVQALRAGQNAQASGVGTRETRTWWWIAGLCAMLCINKQLDLQTLLIEYGRGVALNGNWYEHRRTAEAVILLLLGIAGIIAMAWWSVAHRPFVLAHGTVFIGGILILCYCSLRAADIGHVEFVPLSAGKLWSLEAAGVVLMLMGARSGVRAFGTGQAE